MGYSPGSQQLLGVGDRTLCLPWTVASSAIGFLGKLPAPSSTPFLPGAAVGPLTSSISVLATLGPPCGLPSPDPHCPSPIPGHQVAT